MSDAPPVLVRARDGALYRSPVFIFREGFFRVPHELAVERRGELVLWLDPAKPSDQAPPHTPLAVLARVFRAGERWCVNPAPIEYRGRAVREVPASDPPARLLSDAFSVPIVARTPRPLIDQGFERYASRCRGSVVLDFAGNAEDVHHLEIPE